jgi:N-acetylneuraminic acid mutarotase
MPTSPSTGRTLDASPQIASSAKAASPKSSAVYEYDPIADTWTSRASMREARAGASAVALGRRIYVIGGASKAGTVEEYDPPTDSWTTKTSMNVARYEATGVVSGNLAYVIGGSIPSSRVHQPMTDEKKNVGGRPKTGERS